MLSYVNTYGSLLFYYTMFFLAIVTGHRNGSGQLKDVLAGKGEPGILFMRMIAGIFFLGIGTVVIAAKTEIDNKIFYPDWSAYREIVWLLTAASISIGTLSASNKILPVDKPIHSLPSHLPLSFLLVRTLFLIVYEFFFRGVILFVLVKDTGILAAVGINIALYTVVHWFDKKERYGSMVMGIVLCAVSIYYQSVWPAILIHLSLALSHEISLLVKNRSLIKKSSI